MNNQNEEIKNCCIPDMEDIRCSGVTIHGCANPGYRLYNWDPFHPAAHKHCTVSLNEMQRILNAEIVRATQAETEIKESLNDIIVDADEQIKERLSDIEQELYTSTDDIKQDVDNLTNMVDESMQISEDTNKEVVKIRRAISQLNPNQSDALSVSESVNVIQDQLNGYTLKSISIEEYERLVSSGEVDENTLYFLEESESL